MVLLFVVIIILFIGFLIYILTDWGYIPPIFVDSIKNFFERKEVQKEYIPKLIMLDLNGRPVKIFPLTNEINKIGRGLNNSIILSNNFVSREHAIIKFSRNSLLIADLGSRNGTFLNGVRLRKGIFATLNQDDIVKLGNVNLKIDFQKVSNLEIKDKKIEKEIPKPQPVITPKGFLNLTKTSLRINRKIGEGGMAEVYEAKVLFEDREVAIALKVLKRALHGEADIKERFEREIKINSILNHPYIVKYLGFGVFNSQINGFPKLNGLLCFAMELIRSNTLRYYIKSLNIKQSIAIIIMLSESLSYAHKKGIIHRDIKPDNIFLLKDGKIKVSDFGIAKIKDFASTISLGIAILGTPAYMSPELAMGLDDIDERSDIYSMGVIFYEMVTKRKPFEGNFMTLIYKHANERPVNPIEINSSIPQKLNDIIMKMLEKDKNMRFQNADEIRKELLNIFREV